MLAINPKPNIENFINTIKGNNNGKVPFIELFMDNEVAEEIFEKYLGKKWVKPSDDKEQKKLYWKNLIEVYYRLGYDYIRVTGGMKFPRIDNKGKWAEEGEGIIKNQDDFDCYPWPTTPDLWEYEYVSSILPEGMGLLICPTGGYLEIVMNNLLGYTPMCIMVIEEEDFTERVFQKVGECIDNFYKQAVQIPKVVGIFQGDDMGFNTSTLLSPKMLKKFVLPWHKKMAELAHSNNMLYLLHSCGNLESIYNDLINDVKIDGKHSFEDGIMTVTDFYDKYGTQVAVLGGIDINILSLSNEETLRKYVRNVLEHNKDGRYLLGSGNSIALYIPVENYLIMLDEGRRFNENR